ncbi:hypothetical protein BRC71_10655 [Halobacteriales archaeon QH_7_65_31]|nr:MAG: hypothetical protein BRC71_10655 [Halobacteriales archaeon QH_7_65_31]PSQ29978.1 MAG: hypothetical protein BRD16_08665 [Halobacteriales archaeon SW_6_65_46]
MSDDRSDGDEEYREQLREIAEDLRDDDSESEQLAAILYRVSDLYDEREETDPQTVYRNVTNILEIKERGTLSRE